MLGLGLGLVALVAPTVPPVTINRTRGSPHDRAGTQQAKTTGIDRGDERDTSTSPSI